MRLQLKRGSRQSSPLASGITLSCDSPSKLICPSCLALPTQTVYNMSSLPVYCRTSAFLPKSVRRDQARRGPATARASPRRARARRTLWKTAEVRVKVRNGVVLNTAPGRGGTTSTPPRRPPTSLRTTHSLGKGGSVTKGGQWRHVQCPILLCREEDARASGRTCCPKHVER